MATKTNSRKKLIDIMKILYEQTDENNYIDTYQLIEELQKYGHEKTDRKTIDATVKFMVEDLDIDIYKEKSTPNKYHWITREFEPAELKLLVDAVQSSRFISDKRSQQIIQKLKKLTSNAQASELDREIITPNNFKRDSSFVLYSIDAISEAIRNRKQIHFIMVDYDLSKREVPRYDGKVHEVSPYALMWNNDYYYMLGTPSDIEEDASSRIRTYRVDRMKDCSVTELDALPKPMDFKLSKYQSKVFDMFTGTSANVQLECTKSRMMNYLIDRFGKDFKIVSTRADGSFIAEVSVETSPTFYAWVFQFNGAIRIVGPDWAREEFDQMLNNNR